MFLERFLAKPIYLFGGFAIASFAASFGVIGWAIALKLFYGTSLIHTPLPLLSSLCLSQRCRLTWAWMQLQPSQLQPQQRQWNHAVP